LESAVWDQIDPVHHPKPVIRLHTIHNTSSQGPEGSILFDWRDFFGEPDRKFPSQCDWNEGLLSQLEETKKWILSTRRNRQIHLSGHRRLSASLAIGSVFSSVSGFVIEMETKDGIWSTQRYPTSDTPDYSWMQTLVNSKPVNELVIGIGVMKDIATEVDTYLQSICYEGPRLYLIGEKALISDQQTNLAVNQVKRIILEKVAQLGAKKIHFFVAGPAQFAIFLAHRLNATGEIQCYERQAPNIYLPTCLIQT
jgi:hypothetical protein